MFQCVEEISVYMWTGLCISVLMCKRDFSLYVDWTGLYISVLMCKRDFSLYVDWTVYQCANA